VRLLDTDVMIDVLRGFRPAVDWLESLGDEPALGLPGFVVMELIVGEQNKENLERLTSRLRPFNVYWASVAYCERVLSDLFDHHLSGGLHPLDALIGAVALTRKAVLCTFNTRHFSLISGLRTEQPYEK
jgi:predicted nucleic acid-binding protein